MSDLVLSTGDAHMISYTRSSDLLTIELELWNELTKLIVAHGVRELHDVGTWECDAIVRDSSLDGDEVIGYAIVDTERNRTLRFNAERLDS